MPYQFFSIAIPDMGNQDLPGMRIPSASGLRFQTFPLVNWRKGSNRVIRGGSWNNNNPQNYRSANRNNNNPSNDNNNNGFRVVCLPHSSMA